MLWTKAIPRTEGRYWAADRKGNITQVVVVITAQGVRTFPSMWSGWFGDRIEEPIGPGDGDWERADRVLT